jgi:hypothetical protein
VGIGRGKRWEQGRACVRVTPALARSRGGPLAAIHAYIHHHHLWGQLDAEGGERRGRGRAVMGVGVGSGPEERLRGERGGPS